MRFDDIDIAIIHYLHDSPNKTTSDIAKKIFEHCRGKELKNNDALVRARLKKMMQSHVAICSPTTPKTYNVNPEFVFVGEGTLDIKVNGGRKIELHFGDFLVITDTDNFVHVNRIINNGDEDIEAEIIE